MYLEIKAMREFAAELIAFGILFHFGSQDYIDKFIIHRSFPYDRIDNYQDRAHFHNRARRQIVEMHDFFMTNQIPLDWTELGHAMAEVLLTKKNFYTDFNSVILDTVLEYLRRQRHIADQELKKIPKLATSSPIIQSEEFTSMWKKIPVSRKDKDASLHRIDQSGAPQPDRRIEIEDPKFASSKSKFHVQTETTGGVDLMKTGSKISTNGPGVNFPIPSDLENLRPEDVQSVTPVILRMESLTNLPLFLGLKEEEEDPLVVGRR